MSSIIVSGRLGVCQECEAASSRYCCPGCALKTCSLACVQKHKKTSGCSGVRCKTKFISVSNFSDSHLLSDYYFLEDVGRVVDASRRERRCTAQNHSDGYKKHHHLSWVCSHARRRGTAVKLLPVGMTKHKMNTSKTVRDRSRKGWLIHWRIHLHFTVEDVLFQEESVSEETVLKELLERYIHPTKSDPIARHRLVSYVSSGGTDGVEVWLEGKKGVPVKKLDVNTQLRENFCRCTITEFPTLLVGIKGHTPESTHEVPVDGTLCRVREIENSEEKHVSVEGREDSTLEEGEVGCETSDVATDRHSEVDGCGQAVECGTRSSSLHLIADSYSHSEGSDEDYL